jgi:hypothetical protein
VKLEITPEPSPEEREALERALARLDDGERSSAARSAWWKAGLEEDLSLEEEPA